MFAARVKMRANRASYRTGTCRQFRATSVRASAVASRTVIDRSDSGCEGHCDTLIARGEITSVFRSCVIFADKSHSTSLSQVVVQQGLYSHQGP